MIIGLDLSLNHYGACLLKEDGSVSNYIFLTNVKKFVDADKDHGHYFDCVKNDGEDSLSHDMRRIYAYGNYLPMFVKGDYVSIEGYAFRSQTNSICQIAELTGEVKYNLYLGSTFVRVHDPLSVKLFATGNGHATKFQMRKEAADYGFALPDGLFKTVKKGQDLDGPGTDVVDAYWLAKLLYIELKLRKGEILLKDLPEHQIQVFNRVTKAYPENILSRGFIHKEQ